MMSDPVYQEQRRQDVERERQTMWQRATGERKTFVTFSALKQWTKERIKVHVASLAAVKEFKGVTGEKHRILFGSCDLFGEDGGTAPWKDGVVFSEAMGVLTSGILDSTGATDTAVVFDGGSVRVRRKLEEMFDTAAWKSFRQVTIRPAPPKAERGSECTEAATWRRAVSPLASVPISGGFRRGTNLTFHPPAAVLHQCSLTCRLGPLRPYRQ